MKTPSFLGLILFTTASCSTLTTQYKIPTESRGAIPHDIYGPLENGNHLPWKALSDNRKDVERLWRNLNQVYQQENDHTGEEHLKQDGRKLAVFIDGTNNTKETNTNIWKLYTLATTQACADNAIIPYYREGVGTGFGNRLLGAVAGVGTDNRIKNAYRFLVDTYQPGDTIYIFGFSRGAYIARSLNGFIGEYRKRVTTYIAAY